jgi:hypothetical protein
MGISKKLTAVERRCQRYDQASRNEFTTKTKLVSSLPGIKYNVSGYLSFKVETNYFSSMKLICRIICSEHLYFPVAFIT